MKREQTVKELYNNDPSRHCREVLALDAEGKYCRSDSPNAVKWCIVGAVYRVYGEQRYSFILDKIAEHINSYDIVGWNNNPNTSFDEINRVVTELNI
jgi:hypothetical protein